MCIDMFIQEVNGLIVGSLYDSLILTLLTFVLLFCFTCCISFITVSAEFEFLGHFISYQSCDITNEGKR
jgi:hypothetical protein